MQMYIVLVRFCDLAGKKTITCRNKLESLTCSNDSFLLLPLKTQSVVIFILLSSEAGFAIAPETHHVFVFNPKYPDLHLPASISAFILVAQKTTVGTGKAISTPCTRLRNKKAASDSRREADKEAAVSSTGGHHEWRSARSNRHGG